MNDDEIWPIEYAISRFCRSAASDPEDEREYWVITDNGHTRAINAAVADYVNWKRHDADRWVGGRGMPPQGPGITLIHPATREQWERAYGPFPLYTCVDVPLPCSDKEYAAMLEKEQARRDAKAEAGRAEKQAEGGLVGRLFGTGKEKKR